MTRAAVVANAFYAGDRQSLIKDLEGCFRGRLGPGKLPEPRKERAGKVVGLVCPHAGYVYSGAAAAHSYAALAEDGIPEVAVILGPNHSGIGEPVAVAAEDEWMTPLGAVRVDLAIANTILRSSSTARSDNRAHSREHSLEVQLPFLKHIGGDSISIVPITVALLSQEDSRAVAEDLGAAIASALEGIANLDPEGLLDVVHSHSITMCGAVGAAAMLHACLRLGATSARQLTYYTSGDVTGDRREVVGYGSVVIERA